MEEFRMTAECPRCCEGYLAEWERHEYQGASQLSDMGCRYDPDTCAWSLKPTHKRCPTCRGKQTVDGETPCPTCEGEGVAKKEE